MSAMWPNSTRPGCNGSPVELDPASATDLTARVKRDAIDYTAPADGDYELVAFWQSPDGQNLDNFYLARPGADEVQLDLFGDYKSNVALYPSFQKYFRTYKPPLLAVWGKNDPFFLPPGAEAYKRDIPDAVVRFLDTGHFALETHAEEIATAIRKFLPDHQL